MPGFFALGLTSYEDYLRSAHWTAFRAAYLTGHASTCSVCTTEGNVQLHHIAYENLGQETDDDVTPLCNGCHLWVHDLVSKGTSLRAAHVKAQESFAKGMLPPKSGYVSNWRKLLNKSRHQTLTELQTYLQSKGLMEGISATKKAHDQGLTKEIDGKTFWHLGSYITMMQRDNKRAKRMRT